MCAISMGAGFRVVSNLEHTFKTTLQAVRRGAKSGTVRRSTSRSPAAPRRLFCQQSIVRLAHPFASGRTRNCNGGALPALDQDVGRVRVESADEVLSYCCQWLQCNYIKGLHGVAHEQACRLQVSLDHAKVVESGRKELEMQTVRNPPALDA